MARNHVVNAGLGRVARHILEAVRENRRIPAAGDDQRRYVEPHPAVTAHEDPGHVAVADRGVEPLRRAGPRGLVELPEEDATLLFVPAPSTEPAGDGGSGDRIRPCAPAPDAGCTEELTVPEAPEAGDVPPSERVEGVEHAQRDE